MGAAEVMYVCCDGGNREGKMVKMVHVKAVGPSRIRCLDARQRWHVAVEGSGW